MSIWDRLFGREVKASAAGSVMSASVVGNPVWSPRDYASFAKEAYVENAIGFRCAKLISSSAATAPWLLTGRDGKAIAEHPLLTLLRRPSSSVGGNSLFEAFYAYLLLSGSGYLESVGPNDLAPPKELWAHRSDRMKVIPGPYGMAQGYEYQANGLTRRWEVDPLTGAGPILHLKEFHPLNDWYGLSRVEPASFGIDRHNAASAHNKALLDNGARPSGALIFKPVVVNGQAQSAPQDIIDKAEARLAKEHGAIRKRGKPLVFGGNIDWQEMGLSPRDMDFGAGKDDAARDICVSFGVPHILIVPGASTYNNVREAKLELWEDTILPILDKAVDALDAWLCPKFGDGLKLGIDLDAISALEPRRETKRKTTIELLDKGVIDDAEAREALQYAPRKPEAVKKIDSAVLKALIDGAKAGTAQLEPLYRYQISVGLLPAETTLDAFMAEFEAETIDPNDPEALAALPPDPNKPKPAEGDV